MAEYIEMQVAIDTINHELLCGSTADACGLETAYDLIHEIKPADVVPWSFLERYADWFCALVPYPEFIREAKQFYQDTIGAMEGGGIDG